MVLAVREALRVQLPERGLLQSERMLRIFLSPLTRLREQRTESSAKTRVASWRKFTWRSRVRVPEGATPPRTSVWRSATWTASVPKP